MLFFLGLTAVHICLDVASHSLRCRIFLACEIKTFILAAKTETETETALFSNNLHNNNHQIAYIGYTFYRNIYYIVITETHKFNLKRD